MPFNQLRMDRTLRAVAVNPSFSSASCRSKLPSWDVSPFTTGAGPAQMQMPKHETTTTTCIGHEDNYRKVNEEY